MEHLKNYLQASKAKKQIPARDAAQIGNLLREVFDSMEQQSALRASANYLATGFSEIDEIIGGLELGRLVAIEGLPGSGKTALALSIALQTAMYTEIPVWICSQSHGARQITKRLLSILSGVPVKDIENVSLTDDRWNALSTAATLLQDRPVRVYDPDKTVEELCQLLRKAETPVLLIADGLSDSETKQNMQLLKELAEEKSCCVIFTCCLQNRRHYVAGGVDKVLHLDRDGEDLAEIEILWNSSGRTGNCLLCWNEYCLLWMDATRSEE